MLQAQKNQSESSRGVTSGVRLTLLSWRNYSLIILITLLIVCAVFWYLLTLGETLYHSMALQGTNIQADLIADMRQLYSSEVVSVAVAHGVKIAPRLQDQVQDEAIPLPVSFALELGRLLSVTRPGTAIKIYSNYPFPWRKDGGPQDNFAREALDSLNRNPKQPFYKFEDVNGVPSLRMARADIMSSACVSCHNANPQSPKKDWKVGDMRGVVEVIRPLDNLGAGVLSSRTSLLHAFFMAMGLALLGILVFALALNLLRNREATILDSELRTSSIVNASLDGIVTIDEGGIIESFSPSAERIFGLTHTEAIGRNVTLLMSAPYAENHNSYIQKYLEGGKPKILGLGARELSAKRADGTIFPMELSVTEVFLGSRRVFTGFVRDITNRKSAERELLQGQKLQSVGELAAGVAHEINTPIQYVGDNIQFLDGAFKNLAAVFASFDKMLDVIKQDDKYLDVAKEADFNARTAQFEYLRSEIPLAISQSSEGLARVAKIVQAMKEFAHPGQTDKGFVDINKIIESTITVSTNEWKYVAEVETQLDKDLPRVLCIAGEMSQAFLNIIVNAAHAIDQKRIKLGTMDKGKITIKTSRGDGFVEIRIKDTGSGMPEEVKARIFDPFFTTKEVGKGTGQGLAITRSTIVDKHDGAITVESEVGIGTEFTIKLPVS